MEYIALIFVVAVVFGLCFLADKGFAKVFRGKSQHESGLSVRLSKRYGSGGLILFVLGLAAIFTGVPDNTALWIGGGVILLTGAGLVVYYLTFGIFYDADSFLLTTFGRKSKVYRFADIRTQQLYTVTGGNTLVELHLADGRAVQLHSHMTDTEKFLNHAFSRWCAQTGRDPDDCDFHDPENSLWFPKEEV